MKRILFSLLMVSLFPPISSISAELPKDPILRLETGMHTDMITEISVDKANRWLVSSSNDKTVRLWALPSGRLTRIFRPPVGEGKEGILYAVAISPDGHQIACSGFTELGSDGGTAIYIFNSETGKMTGRITKLPGVSHLVYSRDGQFLAAGLGYGGLRIYRCKDLRLVGEDLSYGDSSYGAAFATDGRLVTSSRDGYLRLYNKNFNLITKIRTSGLPAQVSFSPNGEKIAVGFTDSTKVAVLAANDLTYLDSPDTTGINNGNLQSVSWSTDGQYLYAGGEYKEEGKGRLIVQWANAGRGKRFSHPGALNSINYILPLNDGGIVYGTADPSIGVYDKNGRRRIYHTHDKASYRGNPKDFLISYDSAHIQFAYELWGKSSARFAVVDRLLEINPTRGESLFPPITKSAGFRITDWEYQFNPKLNGMVLELNQYERSWSLAITPNGESFLLGTEWLLRLFDRKGQEKWQIHTPGVALAVNIARNGKVAVAAFSDGTIRWYNITDGKELLAFFLHKDKKRWVMWTPEGYFDASEGGAKLVGYHLNQGKDKEAIFISMENLYDVFYRPDIVATKFRGDDIEPLITLTATEALKNPPPVAEFKTKITATDKPLIKVCYRISSKGGGIGEVRLFHNAKLIKSDGYYREYARPKEAPVQLAALNSRAIQAEQKRGLQVRSKAQSIIASVAKGEVYEDCTDVEVIAGENEISVAAFNRENTVQGFLETMTFKANVAPFEPRVYVLIAGIDNYQDKSAKLNYAVKDAQDIHKIITAQLATLFKKDQIHTMILTNEQVTRNKLLATLDGLANEIRPGDYFILFTAGHGVLIQNQYYLLTQDYRGDLDPYCMISSNEIVELTKKIKSLNQLLIFDTCHAGGMDNIVSGLYDARMAVIAKKMGLHIYASASSLEAAMDGYKGNGLFTHHLLNGLDNNRKADTNSDKQVSIVELGAFTKEQTIEASGKVGYRQTPMIINFGKDSPLYRLR